MYVFSVEKLQRKPTVLRKLKRKKKCFSRLKCNKLRAVDAITTQTAKNRKHNVFISKPNTNLDVLQ